MLRSVRSRLSHQLNSWVICPRVLRKRSMIVVVRKIQASSRMHWVLWDHHPEKTPHNTACVFARWSRTRRLITCLWLLIPEMFLLRTEFIPPGKRKKKVSRVSAKLPRQFEVVSPPVNPQKGFLVQDPTFASSMTTQSSREKSRRSGLDRRVASLF